MATVTKPIILNETGKEMVNALTKIANAIEERPSSGGTIYGFHIDANESDPSSKVTYLKDAVGMTPAYMDYANDAFNYGSWEDAFFMPRPCMLKSDGTVDYYLNRNNYTLKETGGNSDIANTSYAGNAMMEWGQNGKKIWLKIVPSNDSKSGSVYIADYKADEGFHDYNFHNPNGHSSEHFYTPIYNGSLTDSKLRSLSGQAAMKTKTWTNETTYAKANNTGSTEIWNIENMTDRLLINFLLILMGKSTNTQAVFGQGLISSGSETVNDGFRTGVHNAKGLFYGTNSGAAAIYTNAVKVFGMENYWGFQWRRTNGYILSSGNQKVKLTYGTEDGSTTTGYNADGTGYIPMGILPDGANGGYISTVVFNENGMFGKTGAGSASTHFCDGQWYNNGANGLALFGGRSAHGARCGAFCCALDAAASYAVWGVGASLSCKP